MEATMSAREQMGPMRRIGLIEFIVASIGTIVGIAVSEKGADSPDSALSTRDVGVDLQSKA